MPYFPAMLDSLEPQITDEIEVIFVNDGSTDESAEQLTRFAENKNVRSISVPHSGVSAARNAGIAEAQGDYLWYMDSDDMLYEGIVDVILDHIRFYRGEPDMFYGDFLTFSDDDPDDVQKIHYSFDQYLGKVYVFPDPFYVMYEELNICSMLGSSIFKRSFCQQNGIAFNEKMTVDETSMYRISVLLSNPRIAFINAPLYCFRQHDDSLSGRLLSIEQCLFEIREYEKIIYSFLYNHPYPQSRQIMIDRFMEQLLGFIMVYRYLNNQNLVKNDYDKLIRDAEEDKLLSLLSYNEIMNNLPSD